MKFTPAKIMLLMFVVVGGLIAAYVGKKLLATEEVAPVVRTRNIPMPIADLAPGTVITAAHIGIGTVSEDQLEPEMLLSNRVIIGRVVKKAIPAQSAFHASDLYPPGEYPPIEVAPGSRAVSISLRDSAEMIDGLVSPGQYVDIHFTPNANNGDARYRGGFTMTLFKGVKVLAINRGTQGGGVQQSGNTVTFELSPAQANILLLARDKGSLMLSYNPDQRKGTGGVAVGSEDRATLDEILGLKPLPEPAPPQYSEVYRGTSRNSLQFQDGRLVDGRSLDPRSSGTTGNTPTAGPSS